MIFWLFRRALYFASLWLAVVAFSFVLFHIMPQDPARVILGANASEAQVAALRSQLGLDQPLSLQLASYLVDISQLNFRRSVIDNRAVTTEVLDKLRVTIAIIGIALLLTILYLALSLFAGKKKVSVVAIIDAMCLSLPTMVVAVLVALLMVYSGIVPAFTGRLSSLMDWVALIPAGLVLALYPMAILSRVLRRAIEQLQNSDFVRTARANGLTENRVFYSHVLRNALIPCIAVFSNQIPILFASSFIVEVVFSLPGIGALLVRSIMQRDLPMLEGMVILNTLVVIVCLVLVEASYPLLDPRIKSRHA